MQPPQAPAAQVPLRIRILDSPRLLQADYVYPPFVTRHRLIWSGDDFDWRIRMPAATYAYAGIVFRKPINLEGFHHKMKFTFLIRPARAASFLSFALIDRPAALLPAMSDVELSGRTRSLGDETALVSIPLIEFPKGVPVGSSSLTSDAPASTAERPLDWSSIREIRVISAGGRIPATEISIRELRFQRL